MGQSIKEQKTENKKGNQEPVEEEEKPLKALPNSLSWDMPLVVPPPGTPNSVMREMLDPQIPSAEAEADRLSAGIRSGTPNSVMREMGSRLGSDFSSVHFHSNSESVRRNEAMGSAAYTRGRDVFFGRGGFDPSVAAHELVHTVQQGAVSGHVSQSVPFGTVQRDDEKPKEEGREQKKKRFSFHPLSTIKEKVRAWRGGSQNKGNISSESGTKEQIAAAATGSANAPEVTEASMPKTGLSGNLERAATPVLTDIPKASTPPPTEVPKESTPVSEDIPKAATPEPTEVTEVLSSAPTSTPTLSSAELSETSSPAPEAEPQSIITEAGRINLTVSTTGTGSSDARVEEDSEEDPKKPRAETPLDRIRADLRSISDRWTSPEMQQRFRQLPQLIENLHSRLTQMEDASSRGGVERQLQFLVPMHQHLSLLSARIEELQETADSVPGMDRYSPGPIKRAMRELREGIALMKTDLDQLEEVDPQPIEQEKEKPGTEELPQTAAEAPGRNDAEQPEGLSGEEINDTFRIVNGKQKSRTRFLSRFKLTPDKIENMAVQYRHEFWQNFLDEDGHVKHPENVSGPIDFGLRQADNAVRARIAQEGAGAEEEEAVPEAGTESGPQVIASDEDAAPIIAGGEEEGAAAPPAGKDRWQTAKNVAAGTGQIRNAVAFTDAGLKLGGELENVIHPPTAKEIKLPFPKPVKPGEKPEFIYKTIEAKETHTPFADAYQSAAPWVGMAGDAFGFVGGTVGTFTGARDTIKNFQNRKKGASDADWVQSGLDTLSSASSAAARGTSFAQNAMQLAGNAGFGNWVPGLSIATGALSAGAGAIQAHRGRVAEKEIKQQEQILQNQAGDAAPAAVQGGKTDQQKLMEIFQQGEMVQNMNKHAGRLKVAAGAVSAAAGVTTAIGLAAPIGLGLSMFATALSAFKFGYERMKKRSIRRKVLGDEYGINWKQEMKDVDNMVNNHNPHLTLNDDERRQIILKAHGSAQTNWKLAFKETNLRRANYLLRHADPDNHSNFAAVATAVIEAMGVHKVGDRFAAGAAELLASKLG